MTDFSDDYLLPRSAQAKHRILIIDDDAEMRSMISDVLKRENFEVTQESLASDALGRFRSGEYHDIDLVISDLNMPEMSGIQFCERFRAIEPNVPVILITAFGSIETAIEAIRKGAFDYITKPFKLAELSLTVVRALKYRILYLENHRLKAKLISTQSYAELIGKSEAMREVFELIRRVAPATATVLITGESGTGKERAARAIHTTGPRSSRPFVSVNCTSIPEALLESELFGSAPNSSDEALVYKRCAFVEAEGGTIFLDEIGDMSYAVQTKLLRVLQDKKVHVFGEKSERLVDVRIIASTHKDLTVAIKNGTFREDLYYRLSVIPVVIPPLRHRSEDIPLLTHFFIEKYARSNNSSVTTISEEALTQLMQQSWEGNVRELENVIERAVVLARNGIIEIDDLRKPSEQDVESFFANNQSGNLPTLDDVEKRYIKFILDKTGGRKEKASQILGVARRTLYRKVREYGFLTDSSADENGEPHDD